MNTLRNMIQLKMAAILLFSIFLFSSCAENLSGPGDSEVAPELPPQTTMSMNFDFLNSTALAKPGDATSKTRAHWNWAVLNV
ncbi:MAG: hypothetical protein AAFP70_01295, partial [Calditrichota bacterium]